MPSEHQSGDDIDDKTHFSDENSAQWQNTPRIGPDKKIKFEIFIIFYKILSKNCKEIF